MVIAAIAASRSPAKDGDLAEKQKKDPKLSQIIWYLKDGILPQAEKEAKELILNKGQYVLVDEILYHGWYPENCSSW